MKYKIGDRVRCISDDSKPNIIGKVGTVVDISLYGNVGVDFGEDIGGHSIGRRTNFGYGWYLMEEEVEPVHKIEQKGLGIYSFDTEKESE